MKVLKVFYPVVSMLIVLSLFYFIYTMAAANAAAAAVIGSDRTEETIYSMNERDGMEAVPVKAVKIGGLYVLTDLNGESFVTLEAEEDQNYIAWVYLGRIITLEKSDFSFTYDSDFYKPETLEALKDELLNHSILKHI